MRLAISKIEETAKDRPDGYFDDVISRGTRDGDYLEITPEALSELRAKYRPSQEPLKLPSLARRAANLAKQSAQELTAIAQGKSPISEEEAERRLSICQTNECGQYLKSGECAVCGCPMTRKTPWRSARCPVGLW